MDAQASSMSFRPDDVAEKPVDTPSVHLHRRFFVGPLPEKVISQTEAIAHKRNLKDVFLGRASSVDSESETDVLPLIKDRAFHIFVSQGNKAEDWDAGEARSRTEQLLERWKKSEWGVIWHNRHHHKHSHDIAVPARWIGNSFEVGDLLGANVLLEATLQDVEQQQEPIVSVDTPLGTPTQSTVSSFGATTGQETFKTAPSHFQSYPTSATIPEDVVPSPSTSKTGLLAPSLNKTRSRSTFSLNMTSTMQDVFPDTLTGIRKAGSKDKGKGKQVHYTDEVEEISSPGPVSPSEVLKRDASTMDGATSATASAQLMDTLPDVVFGDVVMRDRMLVRISHTKAENLGANFDESVNRVTRDLDYKDWAEFLVVWRRDIIEIYEDYNTSLHEWAVGHKNLVYIIPLKSARTKLSLYSFVDMTFCITSQPMRELSDRNSTRWRFSRGEGTNVYIFKTKSRSRALDWTWQLWRHLGGQIPNCIDIRNPRLGTQLSIDLPMQDILNRKKASKLLTRRNIVALCLRSLEPMPGWSNFVEYERKRGRTLQLAWRSATHVDWIWSDSNSEGETINWSVLCGLAFRSSPQAPILELRLAEHAPTQLYLKHGSVLVQPPAVEGYAERIRPNTQTKQAIYLTTYHGNLFILSPSQAQPPLPPGSALMLGNMEEYKHTLMKTEIERGIYHTMHATGVCDLRSVVTIRRASHPVSPPHHDQKDDHLPEDNSWFNVWARADDQTGSDDDDEGGEEGLSKSNNRQHVKMKRSFELWLNTGRIIRFEVHSRRVAKEWVEKLRALVFYWKHRHRVDAKDEIDLAQAAHPRVTPKIRVCDDQEHEVPLEIPDLSAPYPALDTLFNWCTIDGCHPIAKEGKLYMRKGIRGQYKLVQLFLVDGHLVTFRISPGNALHRVMRRKINLLDAYICSGYLAALTLPKGQYRPNAPVVARRYEDGLEANDREEDMLFVISYRKRLTVIPPRPTLDYNGTSSSNGDNLGSQPIPSLSEKHKLLVCRTRSKLERDAWCWALNIEIEKMSRKYREREEKLRQTGNLRKMD